MLNPVMTEVNEDVLPKLHLRFQGGTVTRKKGKETSTFFFHDLLTGTLLIVTEAEADRLDLVVALHRAAIKLNAN